MFTRATLRQLAIRPRIAVLSFTRNLQVSLPRRIVNPLLPFDVLEELENDEVDEENKKLLKDKKKLLRQKKAMTKKLKEERGESSSKDGEKTKEGNSNHRDHNSRKEQSKDSQSASTDKEEPIPKSKAVTTEVKPVSVVKDAPSESNQDPSHSGTSKDEAKEATSEGTQNHDARKEDTRPANSKDSEAEASKNRESGEHEEVQLSSSGGGDVGDGNGGGGSGGGGNGPPEKNDKDKEEKEKDEDKKIEEEIEEEEEYEEEPEEKPSKLKEIFDRFAKFLFKCLETIGITLSSVGVLGLSGLLYHRFYNIHVLDKMDTAFQKGDPAYQLAMHKKTNKRSDDEDELLVPKDSEDLTHFWVTRPQQQLLDDIVNGKLKGRYYLLVGEKGTGKTTLIMEAMKKIDGHNVAIFDAHADPEIFRIRLGRALNFAYNEDYIGSLFSIRGPRDTTALLDIERAFNKLEQLAILRRMSGKDDKPLILIINNAHLIKENEEGVQLLELLQQKAESLSGSELVTMLFNSDDYWIYEKLKRLGTRLELIHVRDFNRKETINVLQFIRRKFYPPNKFPELQFDNGMCNKIYDLIGGRPQHISQVARHTNTLKACHEIIDREKTWFLNQCGLLGEEMDDDVMEFGKFSSSAMLLMREFVEMDRKRMNTLISKVLPDAKDSQKDHHLPELPLWKARQVMTRPDYIQQYDNLNIFTVDSDSRVRADSVPMMRAFHEIASQPHFDLLLDETVERVAGIESLGRTREIVMKDLTLGDTYEVIPKDGKFIMEMAKKATDEDDNDQQLLMEEISKSDHRKKWWERRMGRFDQSYLPKTDEIDLRP